MRQVHLLITKQLFTLYNLDLNCGNGSRMTLADLAESWRPYFGSVITILFFLSIVQYALELLIPPGAAGGYELRTIINLALLVLLNPMPEIIYQGRSEGLNMLQESFDFLRESVRLMTVTKPSGPWTMRRPGDSERPAGLNHSNQIGLRDHSSRHGGTAFPPATSVTIHR